MVTGDVVKTDGGFVGVVERFGTEGVWVRFPWRINSMELYKADCLEVVV
jgi:preprotein translocase subunit YajC